MPTVDALERIKASTYVRVAAQAGALTRWERDLSVRRVKLAAVLTGGIDGEPPTSSDYARALDSLLTQDEVALVVLPDLWDDLGSAAHPILLDAAQRCEAGADRLLLTDLGRRVPSGLAPTLERAAYLSANQAARSVAAYDPWIVVDGGQSGERRHSVPPTGHVAGLASRLDRERGAARTPANANLEDIVDLATEIRDVDRTALNGEHVNLIQCIHGRGLQVWGGRTLHHTNGKFIAHRRLVHRRIEHPVAEVGEDGRPGLGQEDLLSPLLEACQEEPGTRRDGTEHPGRKQKTQATLDEGGVHVVLGPWINVFHVKLADSAWRAEGRVHEYH